MGMDTLLGLKADRRDVLKSVAAFSVATGIPGVALAQASGSHVIAAIGSNINTMDPLNQSNHDAMVACQLVFENLVEVDCNGKLQPMLAKELPEISEDALVYTFKLRDNVTFQNGQPFTSEDVKYSFEYVLNPENKALRRPIWMPIEKVEAVEPHVVRIKLRTPYQPMLDLMTKYMGIFPKGSREKYGADFFKNGPAGVGTGPGIFVSRTSDTIEFKRNPTYWRKNVPKWETLSLKVILEDLSRIAALVAGEVHVIGSPPPKEFVRLSAANSGVKAGSVNAVGSHLGLILNTRRPPFDDVNFRRAVAFAIDRKTICEQLCYGLAEPSSVLAPDSSDLFSSQAAALANFNLDKAKDALSKSKYASGAQFEVMYPASPIFMDVSDIAQFLQAQLGSLGITVSLQPIDGAQMINQIVAGNVTAALSVNVGPTDLTYVLQAMFGQGGAYSAGTGYRNPKLDELMTKRMAARTNQELFAAMTEIQMLLASECATVFIGVPKALNLWSTKVSGFQPNVGLTLALRDVALS